MATTDRPAIKDKVIVKGAPQMKRMGLLVLCCIVLLAPGGYAAAQVAGSTTLGVTVEELKAVAIGWSAKKQILGKPVYNEKNVRVGRIDDIIVTPERAVSYVIVGAGGFVGLGRHDVAIPVNQLQEQDGKYVLPGATKEAIKALPKFEYAKK
jgi:sporulation protein YlmC with PRC-barrel domain